MENSTNSADDISLGDLFPDGDYSSIFNDLQSSGVLDWNDNNPSSSLTLLPSVNHDDTYSETTNGSTSSESFRFSSDEQKDTLPIVDDGQMLRNSTFDQNLSITNMLMPQETIENQNVLMYQMYLSIFEGIDVTMSVEQQPKANNRIHYECDGVRFLPDSRYHPLAIHIRNLQRIALAKNQTLGIVMTIVTSTNNPKGQTFVHANDIIYRDSHAIKIAYGCVFVPLRRYNVEEYRRLSILYKKYSDYTFDLTPFDSQCETDVIHEQVMTQKSGKRITSFSTESLSEDECNFETEISNSSKRFKSSTPPLIGLPVTRVSNQFINFDIDRQQ
ncbi:unnamed protein product [Rotaria sordida]|uniref:Uncharacterized protein n=1 Tax=Rotaria sordida TaxID=392033 RepID=A0A814GP43_9BILA|nr:unnamed protein product [Rotaria sordida]